METKTTPATVYSTITVYQDCIINMPATTEWSLSAIFVDLLQSVYQWLRKRMKQKISEREDLENSVTSSSYICG